MTNSALTADTYSVVATIPQVDGATRYLLDRPRVAASRRRAAGGDLALLLAWPPEAIVEERGGRLVAYRWRGDADGAPPPWKAIRAAIRAAEDGVES